MKDCKKKQVHGILMMIQLVLVFLIFGGIILVKVVKELSFLEILPILSLLFVSSIINIVVHMREINRGRDKKHNFHNKKE